MPRIDLDVHLKKIDILARGIINHVSHSAKDVEFRADLAGLLVVTIVASYETCVKDTLVRFASKHHAVFGSFAEKNYEKLNSKIDICDLHGYTKKFGDEISRKFKKNLSCRKQKLNNRIGQDIENGYRSMLSWRHSFAHAWVRTTTIEEAMNTHRLAKRVLYAFEEAFHD